MTARLYIGIVALALAGAGDALAERVSDIASTKHNLSVSNPFSGNDTVKAVSESQICAFCHTPHGAENIPNAPLWNRQVSNAAYTTYYSSSLDAVGADGENPVSPTNPLPQPDGGSKLCLSCHDGTLAINTVNVINGEGLAGPGTERQTIAMVSGSLDSDDTMPPGPHGRETGFTRDLGTDLTNDHPISVVYDQDLALRDGELREMDAEQRVPPGEGDVVAVRRLGGAERPLLPLDDTGSADGRVQCTTCHDPHLWESSGVNIKFLRANRFQTAAPTGGDFDEGNDQICLGCHFKDRDNGGWSGSAHANPTVANEPYKDTHAALRDFPQGIQVWEAGCLNCHDTHTVAGSRRLLREGTEDSGFPKTGGGKPAIEETCYQCHTTAAESALSSVGQVPNIESEFVLAFNMPITSDEQLAGDEVHDIGTDGSPTLGDLRGRDFLEDPELLGKGNLDNRHAECTDCHNPHRVIKNNLFNDNPGSPDGEGTHDHAAGHSNIASGVLRGAWGVEPNYGASDFGSLPVSYTVKRGAPAVGASTSVNSSWVTREYQICLKCHSDFAYDDNGSYDNTQGSTASGRPALRSSGPGTAPGTNDLYVYTNQAMEFQAPVGDRGEPGGNHRSWHPVIGPTGRDTSARDMDGSAFLSPWSGSNIGSQTMYCSDCHGSVSPNGSSVPSSGVFGPHGSSKPFILRGDWTRTTGRNQQDDLCFKCHDYNDYTNDRNDGNSISGFCCDGRGNLHAYHQDVMSGRAGVSIRCTWCHVAVPHGWKNKALLVNLNDVGPEAGEAPGTVISDNVLTCNPGNAGCGYTKGPYYLNARLKVDTWRASGTWRVQDCGPEGTDDNDSKDWMDAVCANN